MSYWSELHSELLELGRQTAAEYRSPFMRGERVITNEEMSALICWRGYQAHLAAQRGDCCQGRRWSLGTGGWCPIAAHVCPDFAAEEFTRLVREWCKRFDKESLYGSE